GGKERRLHPFARGRHHTGWGTAQGSRTASTLPDRLQAQKRDSMSRRLIEPIRQTGIILLRPFPAVPAGEPRRRALLDRAMVERSFVLSHGPAPWGPRGCPIRHRPPPPRRYCAASVACELRCRTWPPREGACLS